MQSFLDIFLKTTLKSLSKSSSSAAVDESDENPTNVLTASVPEPEEANSSAVRRLLEGCPQNCKTYEK